MSAAEDLEEAEFIASERARRGRERLRKAAIPIIAALAFVGVWQWYVKSHNVPLYILPAPTDIFNSLVTDWSILSGRCSPRWWAAC
jgi:ABC-type nitrate/sulfonate/bicarbonate transport system permease component